jgi:putative oxidoreductase
MKRWLFSNGTVDPAISVALLLLRVSVGTMMIALHGWDKYQNFAQKKESFPVPKIALLSSWMNPTTSLACTLFAEVVCSALLIIGIATRPAAAVLAFTMTIAAFVVMGSQPFASKELAVMYLIASMVLLITGAGAYSFDARFSIVKKRMFS